jgi:hypothetical membrane protein
LKARRIGVILAACGVAAPVVFAAGSILAAALYPGYSHSRQVISELAAVDSPVALFQDINSVVFGLLSIAFARGLHLGIAAGSRTAWGPRLIAFSGAANVVEAFLPCDRGCELVSLVGSLHDWIAMFAFLAALAGIFIISRTLGADPNWGRAYQRYSVFIAGAAFLVLIVWLAIGAPAVPGLPRIAPRVLAANGTLQRVFALIILLWIEVMALRLTSLFRRSPTSETPDAAAEHAS